MKFKCAEFEIDSFLNELKEKKSNEKLSLWQFVMMQMHKKQFIHPKNKLVYEDVNLFFDWIINWKYIYIYVCSKCLTPISFLKSVSVRISSSISVSIYQSRYSLCRTLWSTIITESAAPYRYKLFLNSLVPLMYSVGINRDTTILYSAECIP